VKETRWDEVVCARGERNLVTTAAEERSHVVVAAAAVELDGV
jgi:hypothetical protein